MVTKKNYKKERKKAREGGERKVLILYKNLFFVGNCDIFIILSS
jgi:hypothetical protein